MPIETRQPPVFGRPRLVPGPALVWLALAASPGLAAGGEGEARSRTGEQIYRQQCAACHGTAGEGTDEYPRALAGDRSVPQLARLIAKTMPEDDPGTCVGDDADKVAGYIHESFYSKAARERNKPPRIELSRLTVRQYLNTVADLVGGFRSPGNWDDKRGLHGEYFKSRRYRQSDRAIDRVDPEVRFDFGEESPDPEKMDAAQFSIRWEGSVLAPETGDYEFIVRTEHATRLWVNDLNRPLIDATVKSEIDTEHHESIRLLGGRVYPIRLEFSKAKQGVDDSKKNKPKPVKASVALEWKPPHRAAEVIPARHLSPNKFPEAFVVTTPFPPDDRSIGYERGTSVSKAWDQATTDAAIEVAGYVSAHLRELSGVSADADDAGPRLREFCLKLAERAFRRPLSDEQTALYVDRQFEEAGSNEAAVKRVVMLVLKSPRFLYREPGTSADGYDVAARLSFGLWDSPPDPPLLEAAASGRLATREQVVEQAERMVADLRTRAKVREFLLQWLNVEQFPDLSKDPGAYPGFDAAVASDLRTSLELFLDDVVWGEGSDFRQLLLADYVYVNGRLSKLYGGDLPPDAPFQKVALDRGERAGVVTHPYLLSAFAYTATSSPIHRGVFLARSLLGRSLRPPPEAVAPLAPELHAGLTTRERVTLQTSPAACLSCHGMINPLGFGLEQFDAVGRYRSEEKGRPVDATGVYEPPSGGSVPFAGARELASALAGSEETPTAFVEQLFHHLVKQPARAFGARALPDLRRSFVADGFPVRKLIVEIMATSALTARSGPP
jgi:hypothetical protein